MPLSPDKGGTVVWQSESLALDSDDPGQSQDSSLLAVGSWAGRFTLLKLSPELCRDEHTPFTVFGWWARPGSRERQLGWSMLVPESATQGKAVLCPDHLGLPHSPG